MNRTATFIAAFVLGAAVALIAVNKLDNYMWNQSFASFVCSIDGTTAVFRNAEETYCVDMSRAYHSDEALDRLIARMRSNAEE